MNVDVAGLGLAGGVAHAAAPQRFRGVWLIAAAAAMAWLLLGVLAYFSLWHAVGGAFAGAALACLAALAGALAWRWHRLSSTRETLTQTFESLNLGVMVVDPQDRVCLINRRALELVGDPQGRHAALAPHDAGAPVRQHVSQDGTVLEVRSRMLPDGSRLRVFDDVSEQHRRLRQSEHRAMRDPLTGLANRAGFDQDLRAAMGMTGTAHAGFAVLCLDLDSFKQVNDLRGHLIGDRLLVQVAERLRAVVREGDPVARLGGDEFAVAQLATERQTPPEVLARRIIDAIAQPYEIDGQVSSITVSIGIALYPQHGDAIEAVMHSADMAMYQAKQAGRNTHSTFTAAMTAELRERDRLRAALRSAIVQEALEQIYLPMTDPSGRIIQCVIGIGQWTPSHGEVLTDDAFTGLAEATGQAPALSRWSLGRACEEASAWAATVPIVVRLDSAQLGWSDLADFVLRTLRSSGLAPARLEIELAEQTVSRSGATVEALMQALQPSGVRFGLAAFGSGDTGLNLLRRFAFDRVTIDQALVEQAAEDDCAAEIVRAVAALGQTLGRQVVVQAEGSEQHRAWLRDIGCHLTQGFQHGRTLRSDQLRRLLDQGGTTLKLVASA